MSTPATQPERSLGATLAGVFLFALLTPFLILLAIVTLPLSIPFGIHAELAAIVRRRLRERLHAAQRLIPPEDALLRLRSSGGTLICDEDSSDWPHGRLWYTSDRILAKEQGGPHPPLIRGSASNRPAATQAFIDWCTRNYTDEGSGRAALVDLSTRRAARLWRELAVLPPPFERVVLSRVDANVAASAHHSACIHCFYDLSGLVDNICPECGTPFMREPADDAGAARV